MSKPLRKKDLQEELRRRGITFRVADTVATLQQLLGTSPGASSSTNPSPSDDSTNAPIPVPPFKKADLQKALVLRGIKFEKKDNIDRLVDLCEVHVPGFQPAFETKTNYSIVKCALRKVTNIEDAADFERFRDKIDELVNIISRMYRRTSIALAHHIVCALEEGRHIPDLDNQKDTYWKRWLTIGMPEFEFPESEHIEECRVGIVPASNGAVRFRIQVVAVSDRDDIRAHFDEIKDRVGNVLGEGVRVGIVVTSEDTVSVRFDLGVYVKELPSAYFDQVLNYAGHTLKTMVCNNAYVPLFPRLTRLSKNMLESLKRDGLKTSIRNFDVMNAIRSGNAGGFPGKLLSWVELVRSELGAGPGVRLYDDYAEKVLGFVGAVRFNAWMQSWFVRLGVKRLKLMPIFRVQRAHVRLDTKTLNLLAKEIMPDSAMVKELHKIESVSKKDAKKGGFGHKNPDKINEWFPSKPSKKRKSDFDNDGDYEKYRQALAKYDADVAAVKSTPRYIEQKERHDAYVAAKTSVAASLFRTLPNKKAPWAFDGSVMTDGVSISIGYSKTMRVKKKRTKEKKSATDSATRSSSSSSAAEGDRAKEWDRNLPTSTDDTLVCGLDPGRSNLANVSYLYEHVDDRGNVRRESKNFKLTRGRYRTESGIRLEDELKVGRWKDMKTSWNGLMADGASLRTNDSANISTYLDAYKDISGNWWALALKRRESRSNLHRYIGKRKVLDKFFADIDKKLSSKFPDKRVEMAYGSAIVGMKPTGPGEVAVPTSSTFLACKRIFKDRVCIVDENFTTKISWETGKVKELVFLEPYHDDDGIEWHMAHTDTKRAPKVMDEDTRVVSAWFEARAAREKRRKRGIVDTAAVDNGTSRPAHVDTEAADNKVWSLRYPEIRGLRFCPERRMYFDRDQSASLAIARLRTQERLGLPRPSPFCRPLKSL